MWRKKELFPFWGSHHHVTTCRYCNDSGSVLKNGKLLEGSEQKSNMTLTLQRDHSGCSTENGPERVRILIARLVTGSRQERMVT